MPSVLKASGPSRVALEDRFRVRDMHKSFGAVHALDGVDLEARRGEVTALLGDNGAGKSTLVKALSGALVPDSGEILFDETPIKIASPTDAQSCGIATVYQDLALCNNLGVIENLFLGSESGVFFITEEEMEERSVELLKQLDVKLPSLHVPVGSLSGGQRQSIAIARSLIGEPAVVILDEPTAALGVQQTSQVLNLIENLRDRGHVVLLITHNMVDVKAVADKAVVLRLGRNNGVFDMSETDSDTVVAAITGADDNSVSRRKQRARLDTQGEASGQ